MPSARPSALLMIRLVQMTALDFAMTREMTSFSTTFSVIVIACKIGTELENNELNVRVIVASTDFFIMSPNIGSLRRNVSSKNLPSLVRLSIQIPTDNKTTTNNINKYQYVNRKITRTS